jgi:hypothetical protein
MLSYHYVRENVAAGVIRFAYILGEHNPADTLSKHWAYQAVWPLIRPILFWSGDTMKIYDEEKPKVGKKPNRRGVMMKSCISQWNAEILTGDHHNFDLVAQVLLYQVFFMASNKKTITNANMLNKTQARH